MVELAQLLHYQLSDDLMMDLWPLAPSQLGLDLVHELFDCARTHRAFGAGLGQAGAQLGAAELLPPSVLFHYHQTDQLGTLIGREASATTGATATAAGDRAVLRVALVQDLGGKCATEGALHVDSCFAMF